MAVASTHPNLLLESAIHRTLGSALDALGCKYPPKGSFTDQIQSHLRSRVLPFSDTPQNRMNLWKSLEHAPIIATEVMEEERLGFLVRGAVHGHYVDMRLAYQDDVWTVESVAAIHRRPVLKAPLFRGLAGLLGLCAAAVAGGMVSAYHFHAQAPEAVAYQWAYSNGYQIVKRGGPAAGPAHAPSQTPAAGSGSVAKSGSTQADKSGSAKGTTDASSGKTGTSSSPTLSFTLQNGESLQDLGDYLKQQGLIPDEAGFMADLTKQGIDQHIRPGTYTFKPGMSETDIDNVLEKGPTS